MQSLPEVSKYKFFFVVFTPNTGNYGPEKTPYLDTFQAVSTFPSSKEEA